MATYAECLAALPDFRNDLHRNQMLESPMMAETAFAFSTRGAFSAFSTPLTNVHATGVGIRQVKGEYDPSQHVIKVFVFDKVEGEVPGIPKSAVGDIPVDVEHLPIQVVRFPTIKESRGSEGHRRGSAHKKGSSSAVKAVSPQESQVAEPLSAAVLAPQALPPQRERHRPIVGGLSISPLNVNFVGTLGCFLLRRTVDTEEVFVLSNNHVLADVDSLPKGTLITQPGPELPPFLTDPNDTFAALHTAIPIQFPVAGTDPVVNRFDAAIANVTNGDLIKRGSMFGMARAGQDNPGGLPVYDPSRVVAPVPGMRVMKMGRTTGFTRGMIIANNLQGTQVNYGTPQAPRIAIFRGTIRIVGDDQRPFSLPGDSGSVILEEATGHPVALLFAGDRMRTTACDLGALCQFLGAWPI